MAVEDVKRLQTGRLSGSALLLLVVVSIYLLHAATQNPDSFSRHYPTLLVLSGIELVLLLWLIGANVHRLVRQYRAGATGSRLSVRLVVMFVILAVVPVSVVYYFSLEFLRRGVDNWFDVRIEVALQDALRLSQAALDERMREQLRETERMARELSLMNNSQATFVLDDMRERAGASELTLLTQSGRIIASSSANPTQIVPNHPHETILLQARQGSTYVGLDPIADSGLHVRVVAPVPHLDPTLEQRVLQLLTPVAARINELADSVQSVYAEYEKLSYLRGPLKFSFLLTLSLVLLITLFTAVWAAFYSARRLVAPIRVLAIGTRLVSAGDYGKQLPLPSTDELGVLVQSFNDMTRKIAQARDEVERSQRQTEEQKAYLEAVLGRLSSGVLAVDSYGVVRAANAAADQILGIPMTESIGCPLDRLAESRPHLRQFADALKHHLGAPMAEWRDEITLFGSGGRQVLMCRGAALPAAGGTVSDHVVVFDDITALIQAQRDAAWGEVARRLAHEIKNPLTPIQLSAERLRHKYLKTMDEEDARLLDRSTHTIVQQVEVMKEMVKAFSDYARPPKLNLRRTLLNKLVNEVLDLYHGDDSAVELVMDLEPDLPPIDADVGRMRQLLHNLMKNAIEAVAGQKGAKITVTTRVRQESGVDQVELSVVDNGPGIPDGVLGQIFEPYVTTKPKGTGLGLAIVKKIVDEHGGMVVANNGPDGGAQVAIRFPVVGAATATAAHHNEMPPGVPGARQAGN